MGSLLIRGYVAPRIITITEGISDFEPDISAGFGSLIHEADAAAGKPAELPPQIEETQQVTLLESSMEYARLNYTFY